jgi:hypothetical protein
MRKAFADVQEFNRVAGRKVGDLRDPKVPLGSNWLAMEAISAHGHLMKAVRIFESTGRYDSNGAIHSLDSVDALLFLRARLLCEETAEIVLAIARGDTAETADGLADLIYVVLDAAVAFGIDMGPVWEAVQAANMAKFPRCARCHGSGAVDEPHGDGKAPKRVFCPECGGQGLGRVVLRDKGGKVVKPPGWTPPDIAAVLERQRKPAL